MELKHLANKMITPHQAIQIAASQTDLGTPSKNEMITALTGSNSDEKRHAAFSKLDPISKFIVSQILDDDTIEGSETTMRYLIKNIEAVRKVLEKELQTQNS